MGKNMGKNPVRQKQAKGACDKMGKLSKARLPALIKKSGRVGDGDGLYFRTLGDGDKAYWLYRYRINGRERETSIGPYPEVSLDDARVRHAALRKQVIADKIDPLEERERKATAPALAPVPTFGQVADAYIAAHEKTWRNPKHRWQWGATLTKHCAPIRSIPIDKLDAKAVLSVLTPIWSETPETASRLRGRIERVWASAQVAGHIDPDKPNPARWKGWLDHMLPNPKKIGERGNHAAMDWRDVPAFVEKLRAIDSTAARALEFLILTASRTGEVIDMPWDEIGDLDAATWTVPGPRMKMKRDHDVPLSHRAVEILSGQLARRSSDGFGDHPFVFEGDRPRRGLSNMALLMLLRRLKVGVTAHGFRSAFRSWCADTGVAFEVAEACLAHSSSSVVAAYQRSAMVERRRPVMEAWALHVGGETSANVVPFRAAG
jgi:integrase